MRRQATVMEGGCMAPEGAVELRFRGQWLRGCGFHAGMRVEVFSPAAGVLELRVVDAAQITAKDEQFESAMAAFERAGI